MKRLIYNENTREIDIDEQEEIQISKESESENINEEIKDNTSDETKEIKKESNEIRNRLEKNRILFEVFSWVFLGIIGAILSVFGNNINNKTMKIYEMQLKIEENDRKPHFTLECENVWEKVDETKGTNKIAKAKYILTNDGGNIKNVYYWAESYIIFYVPTGVEDEWYIFKYQTNNFDVNHSRKIREEEKGRKFVFYEYTSEKEKSKKDIKALKLGKYLSENLNKDITHSYRNILNIMYTDYMGEEKRKVFNFLGAELNELEKNLDGVSVGVSLDAMKSTKDGKIIRMPIDINDTEAVGKALKEEIEDWMKKNKDTKGYKNAAHVFYNYDIIP